MRVLQMLAMVGAVGLAGGATAQEVPLTGNLHAVELTVDNGGAIVVVPGLREIDGRVAACGLSFMKGRNATARAMRDAVLREVMVRLNGRTLDVDASRFARFATEDEARAGKARCSVSRTAWQQAFARATPEITLRNRTVRGG